MATGAPSKAGTCEGPFSAVVIDFMTPVITITVVVVVYYSWHPILLRCSILGGATCQWGVVYDLLWVLRHVV